MKKASVLSDQSKQSLRPNRTLAPSDDDTPKHTASRPNWALAPPDDDAPKQTTARPNWALAPANPLKAPSRRNYIPLPIEDSPKQSAQVVPDPSSALPPHGSKHTPDRPNWALASSDQPDLSGNVVDGLKDRPNWALDSPASPRQSPVINALNGPKHTPNQPNWALAGLDPPRQSNPHVSNALDGPRHTPERPNWALAGSDSPRQQGNPEQSERRGRDRERRRGYAGYDAGAMYSDGHRTRAQKFADQQASKTRIGSFDDQRWNNSPHSTVHSPWEPSLVQDSWNARNKPDEQNIWNNAFVRDTCPNGGTEWFGTDNQFQAPVRVKTQCPRNDCCQLPVDDYRNDLGSRSEWNAERPRNYRDQSYRKDRWNGPAPHSDWNITLGSRAEHSSIGHHQQEEPWTVSQEWITPTDNQRSGREDAYLRSCGSGPDRGVRERPPHDPPRISLQISNAPDVRLAFGAHSSRRHDDIRDENASYGQQWKEPMTSNPKWNPQTLPLEPQSDKRNGVTDWGAWTPDQYAVADDNWKRPPAQNMMIATGCREPGNERKGRNWAPEPRLKVLSDDDVWNRPLDGRISDWLGPTAGSTQKICPVEEPVQNEWNGESNSANENSYLILSQAPRQAAKGHVPWNTQLAGFSKSEGCQAFDDIRNRPPGGDVKDWISPIVREDGISDSSGFSSASKENSTGGDIKTGEGRDWQDRVCDQDLMDSSWGVTSQSTTGMDQSLQDPWSLAISVDDWLAPSSRTKQPEVSQPTIGHTSVSIPIDSPLWSTPPPKIDEWAAKQTAIILESNAQAHSVTDTAANQTKFSVPAEDASLSQNQRGGSAAPFTSNVAVENWIIPDSVPTETLVPEAWPASTPYQVNVLAVPGTGVDQGNGVVAQRSEQSKQDTTMGENKDMVSKQPEADTGEKKSTFLKGKSTPEGGRQKTGMADASSNWRTV